MRVPESLERLLSDSVVGRGVDEKHAEQHDVSSDTAGFCVVDLKSNLRSDLALLDVVEATTVSIDSNRIRRCGLLDIMGCGMSDGEDKHGIGDLSVEPH